MAIMNQKAGIFPKGAITLTELYKTMQEIPEIGKAGAIFSFTGIVRQSSLFKKKNVVSIEIEAWNEKAAEILNQICIDLINKYNLIDIRIWHATGNFKIGEELVFVLLAASHRVEGLQALDEAIYLYKTKAPVWKKEVYEDGSYEWISDEGSHNKKIFAESE